MAAIKKALYAGIESDISPKLTTTLREIANDLASLAAAVGGVDLGESAPAALTSVQEATTNAIDLPTAEALANSLKLKYNALQVDVAAIRTGLAAVISALATSGATVTLK